LKDVSGGDRDRTGDLVVANDALSQLSYAPTNTSTHDGTMLIIQRWKHHYGTSGGSGIPRHYVFGGRANDLVARNPRPTVLIAGEGGI
jgi:hypothetical protein